MSGNTTLKVREYKPNESLYGERLSKQEWEHFRPILTAYENLGLSRHKIVRRAAAEHGFQGTYAALNKRFKAWGLTNAGASQASQTNGSTTNKTGSTKQGEEYLYHDNDYHDQVDGSFTQATEFQTGPHVPEAAVIKPTSLDEALGDKSTTQASTSVSPLSVINVGAYAGGAHRLIPSFPLGSALDDVGHSQPYRPDLRPAPRDRGEASAVAEESHNPLSDATDWPYALIPYLPDPPENEDHHPDTAEQESAQAQEPPEDTSSTGWPHLQLGSPISGAALWGVTGNSAAVEPGGTDLNIEIDYDAEGFFQRTVRRVYIGSDVNKSPKSPSDFQSLIAHEERMPSIALASPSREDGAPALQITIPEKANDLARALSQKHPRSGSSSIASWKFSQSSTSRSFVHTAKRLRSKPPRVDVTTMLSNLNVASSNESESFGAVTGFGADLDLIAEDAGLSIHAEPIVYEPGRSFRFESIHWPEVLERPSANSDTFLDLEDTFLAELDDMLHQRFLNRSTRYKIKTSVPDVDGYFSRSHVASTGSFVVRVTVDGYIIDALMNTATLKIWTGEEEPSNVVQEIINAHNTWPDIPIDLELAAEIVTKSKGNLVLHHHADQYVACKKSELKSILKKSKKP